MLGAILMLEPAYRLSTYDPKEQMAFDPTHTKSPKDYMTNTVIYLRPLSESQIGMEHPEYNDFAALTDCELFEAVRVWVGWTEQGTTRALKDEEKVKHQLVARFLGLPSAYQEALGALPVAEAAQIVKLTPSVKSKLVPARNDGPTRESLPTRSKGPGARPSRVQKAGYVRNSIPIGGHFGLHY
jgi:hypothetical protein